MMCIGCDSEGANRLSYQFSALKAVDKLLNHISSKKSKIVLAGDSMIRQTFSSLASLSVAAHGNNLIDVIDQFIRLSIFHGLSFSNSRFSLKSGSEVIYAPEAGSINTYQ